MSNSLVYQRVIALIVIIVAIVGLLTVYGVNAPDSITGNALAPLENARLAKAVMPTTACREYEGALFRAGPTEPKPLSGGRTITPTETKVDYCAGEEVGDGRRILREYYCKSTQDRDRADVDCTVSYNTWCEETSSGGRCVPCREVYTDEECDAFESTHTQEIEENN